VTWPAGPLVTARDFMALPFVAGLEDHGEGHVTIYVAHDARAGDIDDLQAHIHERRPASLRVAYTRDRRTLGQRGQ
jgi:hypothetical protein